MDANIPKITAKRNACAFRHSAFAYSDVEIRHVAREDPRVIEEYFLQEAGWQRSVSPAERGDQIFKIDLCEEVELGRHKS